jgi:hypothetical protein
MKYENAKLNRNKEKKCSNNSKKRQKTYNTTDYIIKQCFNSLFSSKYKDLINSYCKEANFSYENLLLSLK